MVLDVHRIRVLHLGKEINWANTRIETLCFCEVFRENGPPDCKIRTVHLELVAMEYPRTDRNDTPPSNFVGTSKKREVGVITYRLKWYTLVQLCWERCLIVCELCAVLLGRETLGY